MVAFALFFKLTRAGRFMQATADNPKAAKLVGASRRPGVHVHLRGRLRGRRRGGRAHGPAHPSSTPTSGSCCSSRRSRRRSSAGSRAFRGAVVGGFLIGIIEQLAAGYLHTAMQEVAAFIVIMIVMIFIPTGLFGLGRIRKV